MSGAETVMQLVTSFADLPLLRRADLLLHRLIDRYRTMLVQEQHERDRLLDVIMDHQAYSSDDPLGLVAAYQNSIRASEYRCMSLSTRIEHLEVLMIDSPRQM